MMEKNYNLGYLMRATKGKEEPMRRIIQMFTTEAPELLRHADQFIFERNFDQLRQIFHKLKNSVSLFNAVELELQLRYAEAIAKEDNPQPELISKVIPQLKNGVLSLVRDLRKVIPSLTKKTCIPI